MDFMTKEIIRSFSIYEDYDLQVNSDVDQFSHFRKLNYAYREDDVILQQKPQDERDVEGIGKREFKKVLSFEPKEKSKCKAQVATIDWSLNGRFILATFKVECQIVVWDVLTCEKVLHMTGQDLGMPLLHQAKFVPFQSMQLVVSGDRALLVDF